MAYDMHFSDARGKMDPAPVFRLEYFEHQDLCALLAQEPRKFPLAHRLSDPFKDAIYHLQELDPLSSELEGLASCARLERLRKTIREIHRGVRRAQEKKMNVVFVGD